MPNITINFRILRDEDAYAILQEEYIAVIDGDDDDARQAVIETIEQLMEQRYNG